MPRVVWRISIHPGITGIGGMYSNGRWNSKGRFIIYTAEHPALSLVEIMAHLDLSLDQVPGNLKLCRIEVGDDMSVYRPELPDGWQANELMSRKIGDAWLAAATDPLCEVPSAILPNSTNLLINPAHPAFAAGVREVSVEPIWIDSRFIR
ncbi:MAG: RES family NAD+ phosphorylase [Pseudomonadota bacterium]|nr:RES family NAD+ phosphorylase [Pseudomonadota bacterium]